MTCSSATRCRDARACDAVAWQGAEAAAGLAHGLNKGTCRRGCCCDWYSCGSRRPCGGALCETWCSVGPEDDTGDEDDAGGVEPLLRAAGAGGEMRIGAYSDWGSPRNG